MVRILPRGVEPDCIATPPVARYARVYPSMPDRLRDIVHWLDENMKAAGFAFMVERIEREVAARQSAWVEQFALTPAEVRLAGHLMNGGTIASYAKARDVSRNTVRNQLQAIYCKTGTHRQAELVGTLLRPDRQVGIVRLHHATRPRRDHARPSSDSRKRGGAAMRGQQLILFCFAAPMAALMLLAATPAARASDESAYITEFKRIQQEMRELAGDAHAYELKDHYCLPPYDPLKQPDQMAIDGFKARANVLNQQYLANQQSLVSFFQTNTELRQHLMLEDGKDRADPKYWNKTPYNQARKWMNDTVRAKSDALDKKKERNCAPVAETPKPIVVVAPTPPVQPPPPPAPPPPVDPLNGLTRPTFEAARIPAIADRYCSQAEKDAALAKIPPEIAKVQGQIAQIDAYIAAVGVRRGELEKRGVETHWLNSMDYERRQAEQLRDDRRTTIEALNTTRRAIEQTPVVDCATGKEVGLHTQFTAGLQFAYGDLRLPTKPYLALETGGDLRLGVVDLKRSDIFTVATILLDHRFDCDRMPNLSLGNPFGHTWMTSAEYSRYQNRFFSRGHSIMTTAEGLGIPGTGDLMSMYPAGVFFANPAFNDVTGIDYAHNSKFQGGSLSLSQVSLYGRWNSTLGAGIDYARLDTSDSLRGSVPGYLTDFHYMTDINTRNIGLFVKGGVEVALGDGDRALRYAGEFSGFRVSASAEARANFLDASGTDRLDLTGFLNDAQRVTIGKNDTTFSYRLGASLNYTPPEARALSLSLGVEYGREDTHPVATRSGQIGDKTQIEFKRQDEFIGTVRTSFSF